MQASPEKTNKDTDAVLRYALYQCLRDTHHTRNEESYETAYAHTAQAQKTKSFGAHQNAVWLDFCPAVLYSLRPLYGLASV